MLIFEGGHIYTNGSGASWSVEDDIIFSNGAQMSRTGQRGLRGQCKGDLCGLEN